MKPSILITGSTGTVGRRVVSALNGEGIPVRALIHDPDKARAISGPNVELVAGDISRIEDWPGVWTGIETMFLLTPSHPDQSQRERNLVAAAKQNGVRRIVKQSVTGADPHSSSRICRWHGESEAFIKSAGIKYTFLRPAFFMQNLLGMKETLFKQNAIFGSYGRSRQAMISADDIADVAAAVLSGEGHHGQIYRLTGPEALSFEDVARVISAELGLAIRYVDVPVEQTRQGLLQAGLPSWYADALMEFNALYLRGDAEQVTTTVFDVAHKQPMRLAEFVRLHLAPQVAGSK